MLFKRCTNAAALVVAAASLLGVLAGCSNDPDAGEVKGKITFQGQPVTEGSLNFLNLTEGGSFSADLKPDGTYAIDGGVKLGEYIVVISPPIEIVDTDPGKSPPAPVEKNMPNIPPNYRGQGSSPLRATVKAGPNEINFDMKADGT